jgi:hypothetical protein
MVAPPAMASCLLYWTEAGIDCILQALGLKHTTRVSMLAKTSVLEVQRMYNS